jgi:hypothetical protein
MPRKRTSYQMSRWGHDVHRYVKFNYKKPGTATLWRCILPNCGHYVVDKLVIGRQSICNRCNHVFEMKLSNLTQKKPHCLVCTKKGTPRGAEINIADIAANLDELLKVE